MEQKFLNEEKYQATRKKFLILVVIGIPILIGGIVMAAIGFSMSNRGFGNFESNDFMSGAGLGIAGVFVTFIGLALTANGIIFYKKRDIAAHMTQSMMPIKKEVIQEMTPVYGEMVGEIARNIRGMEPAQAKKCIEQELKKLEELRTKRLITEDEYAQMRKNILGLDKRT